MTTGKMTPDELSSAIEKLWNGNQSQASRELGLSSSRRMREFLSGDRTIPTGVADDIRGMLEMFPTGKKTINPGTVIRVLQSLMVRNGWKPELAAGGILGAACSNARAAGCDVMSLIEGCDNDAS